ncbi:hypothetical protein ACFLQN_02815 [Candidatus Aenigmatarchaeota archaeon]
MAKNKGPIFGFGGNSFFRIGSDGRRVMGNVPYETVAKELGVGAGVVGRYVSGHKIRGGQYLTSFGGKRERHLGTVRPGELNRYL